MDELFIGRKIVAAQAMTRGDFNRLKDPQSAKTTQDDEAGYLVEYMDGGTPNHPDYDGYISWAPKDVFEHANLYLGKIRGYPDFFQRLVAEQVDLQTRLDKLERYLNSEASRSNPQRTLMQLQCAHMRGLNAVLLERIVGLRTSLAEKIESDIEEVVAAKEADTYVDEQAPA